MKFTFEGEEFKISFYYPPALNEELHLERGKITAAIISGMGHEQFCGGHAACAYEDQFRKETGRKVALKRALDKMLHLESGNGDCAVKWVDHFPPHWDRRAFRTAAWKAYLGRKAMVTVSA